MPRVRLKRKILVLERAKTFHALDRTAIVMSLHILWIKIKSKQSGAYNHLLAQ
jgi:hypothetical protein